MKKFLYVILGGYFLIAGLFGIYFEYLYAKENGFINWLFFGWIMPTIQAILWPLYVL